jgi:hypothetical protein
MSVLLALSLFLPAPDFVQAHAQTPAGAPAAGAPAASARRTGYDPNQTICRRDRESGSRLVIRRVCMTRQEWADYHRELRQNVDRAQTTRVHAGQ